MMGKIAEVESWRSLHERLRGIGRRRAMLDAEEARCLRDAEAMQLWRHLGYVHMVEYLERELGYEPSSASERMRVARVLNELPQLEVSLGAGVLPYCAVRELSRIATGETEQAWIEAARGKTVRQIEVMVSGRKRGDRPADPADPDLRTHVVRLELSPEAFALLRQVQGMLADEHGGRLEDSALVEVLCRRALEGGAGSARPAHQIALTVCESCERGWQDGAGHEIEVGPETIERARCDAELVGSLAADVPARVTSTVTPRLRRQVFARDHHRCVVPGCRSARNLDLHHVEYQRDGGRHQLWNLVLLCSGHHARVHEGTLRILGKAPGALEFQWRGDRNAPSSAREGHGTPAGETAGRHEQHQSRAEGAAAAALDREAREALTTAGYRPHEAHAAVATARSHVGAAATLAELVRDALRCCALDSAAGRVR